MPDWVRVSFENLHENEEYQHQQHIVLRITRWKLELTTQYENKNKIDKDTAEAAAAVATPANSRTHTCMYVSVCALTTCQSKTVIVTRRIDMKTIYFMNASLNYSSPGESRRVCVQNWQIEWDSEDESETPSKWVRKKNQAATIIYFVHELTGRSDTLIGQPKNPIQINIPYTNEQMCVCQSQQNGDPIITIIVKRIIIKMSMTVMIKRTN